MTKKTKKTPGHYVNGREVTEILNAHHRKRKELIEQGVPDDQLPPLPDVVGMAIEKIAYGYARKFSAAADVEEMTRCGIFLATETLAKIYDPDKSKTKNCFSLITTLCYFGFLNHFTSEKKAKKEQNSFLEALSNGQVTIGNEIHDQNFNTSLKELRKLVDDFRQEEELFEERKFDKEYTKDLMDNTERDE